MTTRCSSTLGGRERIYNDAAEDCFAPLSDKPQEEPPALPSLLPENPTEMTGAFFVQDVNIGNQPLEADVTMHLRINEIVVQPSRGVRHRSYVGDEVAKQIVGTVPVGADGSAYFSAPAGVPLQFQALYANGMAATTMRSFVQLNSLQAGE